MNQVTDANIVNIHQQRQNYGHEIPMYRLTVRTLQKTTTPLTIVTYQTRQYDRFGNRGKVNEK
jgi:hypothetical protein